MARAAVCTLVPMAHVAAVPAAAAFYEKLGFTVEASVAAPGEDEPHWASLASGEARLMLARASEPVVPAQQAVLFYLHCPDVAAMHAQLTAEGLTPGAIATPFYNPDGEFRLIDPDGYVIMVAQAD
jgi:predicted enzyme related to lactoylglutathione lyase